MDFTVPFGNDVIVSPPQQQQQQYQYQHQHHMMPMMNINPTNNGYSQLATPMMRVARELIQQQQQHGPTSQPPPLKRQRSSFDSLSSTSTGGGNGNNTTTGGSGSSSSSGNDDSDDEKPLTKRSTKKRSKTQTSKFRGVSKCSKDGRWQARIRVKSGVKYLGRFKTEEEAAVRYDEAARIMHASAVLNFPNGDDLAKGRRAVVY